ncbi:MAG: hypothetical protein ABEJ68_02375 [Halobacteriaceae archaeon]
MVGRTLTDLRNEIASLATPDGAFRVVCARTGERPVPSADLRFPNRETAAEAAVLTEQYRATLRRYDPRLPRHEPIVSEAPAGLTHGSGDFDDPTRIEFCHRVVAAVFETLVADGHRGVETAVMDAYLARAERVTDRERLCLALLRCVADEITRAPQPDRTGGGPPRRRRAPAGPHRPGRGPAPGRAVDAGDGVARR